MPGVAAALVNAELGVRPRLRRGVEQGLRPATGGGEGPVRGRPWVAVLADTAAQAADAAEAVVVDYEPLPAVVDPEALAPDAPIQFDELGSNRPRASGTPKTAMCSRAPTSCAGASSTSASRSPMEGNAIAVIPGEGPTLTVYVSRTQMPHLFRTLACRLLDIAEEDMRHRPPRRWWLRRQGRHHRGTRSQRRPGGSAVR